MEKLSIKGPQSDHKTDIERQLDALESRLRTVQLSLEILTGVCATLPDPETDTVPDEEGAEDEDEDVEADDGKRTRHPSPYRKTHNFSFV
jgi:hypothetical protein